MYFKFYWQTGEKHEPQQQLGIDFFKLNIKFVLLVPLQNQLTGQVWVHKDSSDLCSQGQKGF